MTTGCLVDTSALYAVLDADDANHPAAAASFDRLLDAIAADDARAITHSGVVTEACALVQRRLGIGAMRALLDDLLPLLHIVWVDQRLHSHAGTALLAAGRRDISLVDWTSFVVMREHGLTTAFAFDPHFVEQGFALLDATAP